MKRIKKWKWLLPVLITLMTVILLKSVFLFGYVPTASMEPTLPKDCYYVLGDNAGNSLDSRYWEEPFVKEEEIVAKYLAI